MYTFDHEETDQTGALTDYRYIGNDPYNYITFNNELWRIIGVFKVEDETGNLEERIKIIRNNKLSNNMAWNSNNVNEWSTASLNVYLNGNYYDSLSEFSKQLILNSSFYLGEGSTQGDAETYYTFERSINVQSGRSTNWNGMIAMMYPSDYVYTHALGVDNTCYSNGGNCSNGTPVSGWIYNTNGNSEVYLLSANSTNTSYVYDLGVTGFIGRNNVSSVLRAVRPVIYLKSNIKIKSGDGSVDSPYEFEL